MSTSIHCVISVDIDRFSDTKLRKELCCAFRRDDGSTPAPSELREACRAQRRLGLTCFPNPDCDSRKPTGQCAGHQEPDEVA